MLQRKTSSRGLTLICPQLCCTVCNSVLKWHIYDNHKTLSPYSLKWVGFGALVLKEMHTCLHPHFSSTLHPQHAFREELCHVGFLPRDTHEDQAPFLSSKAGALGVLCLPMILALKRQPAGCPQGAVLPSVLPCTTPPAPGLKA